MKLKVIYATQEEIPEQYRDLFVEREGKFWLDAEGVEDVSGLKSALSKERTGRQTAEATLRALKEAGIETAEQARELTTRMAELQSLDPNKEADKIAATKLEELKKQLVKQHEKDIDKYKTETGEMRGQLEEHLITASATKAIAEAKGSVDLLLPIIQRQSRIRKAENGKFIVEIIGADNMPRIGDSNGNAMTIEQLVTEMKGSERFGRAFESSGTTGTGGPGDRKGGPPPPSGKVRQIARDDQEGINASIEDIAAGKAVVVD